MDSTSSTGENNLDSTIEGNVPTPPTPQSKKLTLKEWFLWIGGLIVLAVVIFVGSRILDTERGIIKDLNRYTVISIGVEKNDDFRNEKDYRAKSDFVQECLKKRADFLNCGIYSIDEDKIFWIFNGGIIDTTKKVGGKNVLKPGGLYTVNFNKDDNHWHFSVFDPMAPTGRTFTQDAGSIVKSIWIYDDVPEKIGVSCYLFPFEKISMNQIANIKKDDLFMPVGHKITEYYHEKSLITDFDGLIIDLQEKTFTWQNNGKKILGFDVTNLEPDSYETGFYRGRVKHVKDDDYEAHVVYENGYDPLFLKLNSMQDFDIQMAFGGENYPVMVINNDTFSSGSTN